jgi:thymidylate synthase ThyX
MEREAPVAEFVEKLMKRVWKAIDELRELGAPWDAAQYLLPNAFPIRFEESGDLMHLHHKWTTRLCYLAQEEIWRCCVEEVRQVATVHPTIAAHLVAPLRTAQDRGRHALLPGGKTASAACGSGNSRSISTPASSSRRDAL